MFFSSAAFPFGSVAAEGGSFYSRTPEVVKVFVLLPELLRRARLRETFG
jgi:hypothetical protein